MGIFFFVTISLYRHAGGNLYLAHIFQAETSCVKVMMITACVERSTDN